MKKFIIKLNLWINDYTELTAFFASVIAFYLYQIGEQIYIPLIVVVIVIIRGSFSFIKAKESYKIIDDDEQLDDDDIEVVEEQIEYWWDIIGTVIDANSKSYDDSLKIIKKLQKKYQIDKM